MLTGPTALINMTNRRFGRLVALSRVANARQNAAWHVRCDCGTETVALATDLRSCRTRSCGCIKHEIGVIPRGHGAKSGAALTGPTRFIDLTGQRFERLVVTGRAPNIGDRTAWHVRCDCGVETIKLSLNLRSGVTRSCGCLMRDAERERGRRRRAARRTARLAAMA